LSKDSDRSATWKPPASGWIWITDYVVERIPAIGIAAFAVYAVLAKYADRHGTCFPSIRTIKAALSIGSSTVSRSLKTLEEHGLIKIEKRPAKHAGFRSNLYRLTPHRPVVTSGTPPVPEMEHPVPEMEHPVPEVEHPVPEMTQEQEPLNKTPLNKTQEQEGRVDHLEFSCSWMNQNRDSIQALCRQKFVERGDRGPLHPEGMTIKQRSFLLKLGALVVGGAMPEAWVDGALEAVDKHDGPVVKPGAYLMTVLAETAQQNGRNLNQMLARVDVPEEMAEPKPRAAAGAA